MNALCKNCNEEIEKCSCGTVKILKKKDALMKIMVDNALFGFAIYKPMENDKILYVSAEEVILIPEREGGNE